LFRIASTQATLLYVLPIACQSASPQFNGYIRVFKINDVANSGTGTVVSTPFGNPYESFQRLLFYRVLAATVLSSRKLVDAEYLVAASDRRDDNFMDPGHSIADFINMK
jgi:hypothetical protein